MRIQECGALAESEQSHTGGLRNETLGRKRKQRSRGGTQSGGKACDAVGKPDLPDTRLVLRAGPWMPAEPLSCRRPSVHIHIAHPEPP